MLGRRLRQPLDAPIAERVAVVHEVRGRIRSWRVRVWMRGHHTHWLFPVMSADPEKLKQHLWREGFDATCGASNLLSRAGAGWASAARAGRAFHARRVVPAARILGAAERDMQAMARVVRD